MTEPDAIPEPEYAEGRRRLSLVWLMPVLAILLAIGVAWQTYADRGPLIFVTFPSAAGIEVDKTALQYRDVQVGLVERIDFSDDLQSVQVALRIDKQMAPFIDQGARFWLIRPEVSARGITGLDTVLSGVYIEGSWDGRAGTPQTTFDALENPPIAKSGEIGTTVLLRSDDGRQLAANAPVLFNGIEVGRLGDPRLDAAGNRITIEAFIAAPHDQRLTSETRFWDSSGFSISLGAGGVSVDVESLAALVEGGVSFGTLVSGGDPIGPGQSYSIYASEEAARASVFEGALEGGFDAGVLLESDVDGLVAGAIVRYRGIKVGEVVDITGFVPVDRFEDTVRPLATLMLQPERLGIADTGSTEAVLEALRDRVALGLRARLSSEGLFARSVILELVDLPEAPPADLDTQTTFVPLIPVVEPALDDSGDTLDGLVRRVDNLPIEELLASAIDLMDSVTSLTSDPEIRAIPSEARGLLTDTRARVTAPEIDAILRDLQVASADLRGLVGQVNDSDGVAQLLVALERSDEIATNLAVAAEGLPALSEDLEDLVDDLGAMPLEQIASEAAEAMSLITSALADDALGTIVPTLARTLEDAEAAASDLRRIAATVTDSDGIATLLAALGRSDEIAQSLATASAALPDLTEQAGVALTEIADLPLGRLTEDAGRAISRLDALLADEAVATLAPSLAASLGEAEDLLRAFRDADTAAQLNAALSSAQTLTDQLTRSTEGLPEIFDDVADVVDDIAGIPLAELTAQATDVVARVDGLLQADGIEDIPTALSGALVELQAALEELRAGGAVASLNETLASANSALRAVDQAAQSVPALTQRLNGVAGDFGALIATYTNRSRFNEDLMSAIRAAGDAAQAFRSLARTIERDPSSVLRGR